MIDKQEEQIQTAIRVPGSFLKRADKLAERMSRPGLRLTRADVLRLALAEGFTHLETEQKKARP